MIRALLRKELREHGIVLLATLALSALALLGMLVTGREAGGRFTALVRFVMSLGAINALVVANRLFVREYAAQTQLFLETLPIGRARVFATKWLLGLVWLAALTVGAWWWTLEYQREVEIIELNDALTTLVSVSSFMLVMWAFAAMAGMLGRHRYTVWIVVALGVAAGGEMGVAADDVALLRLVGERATMARSMPRSSDLFAALAFAATFVSGAAALALYGSGAIAAQLARRSTARERVFTLVLALLGLFLLDAIGKERKKPPFTVTNATYVDAKHARVGVMNTQDLASDRALSLAKAIGGDLDALIDTLGLAAKPSVFVLPQQGIDRALIERAELDESEGIVLRASPEVPALELRARAIHELLSDATKWRAAKDDRHALLDGFALHWASRDAPEAREKLWLRAAASRIAASERSLSRWDETSEQLGDCVSGGLAFALVDALVDTLGERRARAFAKALFTEPPDDARVLFTPSVEDLLERAGITWSELATAAEVKRSAARNRYVRELAAIPTRRVVLNAQRSAKRGSSIVAQVEGAAAYWVTYAVLGPWERRVLSARARLDVAGRPSDAGVSTTTLPLSPTRGSRVLVEVETAEPVLGCALRLHAERVRVP